MMSRKDYEKAAEIVRTYRAGGDDYTAITGAFVALFTNDNPRFDVDRFHKACQPKEK